MSDRARDLFAKKYWEGPPSWPCPRCFYGSLVKLDGSQPDRQHGWSKDSEGHPAWEPHWDQGVFAWDLQCSILECQHRVVATGTYFVDFDFDYTSDSPTEIWRAFYTPTAFSEAPPIFTIGSYLPESIAKSTTEAFALFWIDRASCLNKIRQCIEQLLTSRKIPRFTTTKGKKKPLPLHTRIEKFTEKNSKAGEALMALKWLGNEGSHANRSNSAIDKDQVIKAFQILEHALEIVFDPRKTEIGKTVKNINKKKGL